MMKKVIQVSLVLVFPFWIISGLIYLDEAN